MRCFELLLDASVGPGDWLSVTLDDLDDLRNVSRPKARIGMKRRIPLFDGVPCGSEQPVSSLIILRFCCGLGSDGRVSMPSCASGRSRVRCSLVVNDPSRGAPVAACVTVSFAEDGGIVVATPVGRALLRACTGAGVLDTSDCRPGLDVRLRARSCSTRDSSLSSWESCRTASSVLWSAR